MILKKTFGVLIWGLDSKIKSLHDFIVRGYAASIWKIIIHE